MSAMSFFQGLGPWNWFLIAIVLFGLEMLTPGIHLLWFGLAAIVTGVMGLALGISWQWQLVAYAILSVVAMFMARSFSLKRGARTDTPGLNQRGTEYIGRTVVVEEAIRGGRGKVRVGDTLWIAEGPEAPHGARVKVTGVRGSVLVVERE
ncbi:MAG: NfeD family protein [Hyphomicrobiaceae bacterium]